MNGETNIGKRRFAACAAGARLLSICVRAARRAPASESVSLFHLSAGCHTRDRFRSVSQKNKKSEFNALRNFSRESSAAQNSKPKTSPRN
jgi:hypothetical protein